MRLKDRRAFSKPEVMIIPMIDIMFFLLVFFMLSTLYMVDLKTIPVNMPKVQNAQSQTNVNYLVTMKADGTLYLENKLIDEDTLLQGAKEKYEENNNFAVVIRADENVDYGKIMALLDKFKRDDTGFQVLSLRFRNRISDNQFQFEYINVLFDQNGRYSFLTDRPDINDISPNAESSAIYMLENDYLKRALDEVDCEFVVEECK